MTNTIPFSPPFINDKVINEVIDSLNSGWITTGPKVKKLEEKLSEIIGIDNIICINSATSGLMLALHLFGIGKNDEVIIPAYTYAATALAVMHLGAKPVMVDCSDDFNINTKEIFEKINSKTKAIIPVDLAGFPCDYDSLHEIIETSKSKFIPSNTNQEMLGKILLLSDSAHSIGSKYKNKHTALYSDISVFSFHAVKNVTSAEGGAICLNLNKPFSNNELYKFLKLISLNGQTKDAFTKSKGSNWKYDIVYRGFKANMPDVLAAIALSQLEFYELESLKKRKEIFEKYNSFFGKFDWAILPPYQTEIKESSYHVYLLRIKGISEDIRDKIIEDIFNQGVSVNVHFQPLPILTLFKYEGYNIDDYPVSYANYKAEISLPVYQQLKDSEIEKICNSVKNAYEKNI